MRFQRWENVKNSKLRRIKWASFRGDINDYIFIIYIWYKYKFSYDIWSWFSWTQKISIFAYLGKAKSLLCKIIKSYAFLYHFYDEKRDRTGFSCLTLLSATLVHFFMFLDKLRKDRMFAFVYTAGIASPPLEQKLPVERSSYFTWSKCT